MVTVVKRGSEGREKADPPIADLPRHPLLGHHSLEHCRSRESDHGNIELERVRWLRHD